MAIGLVPVTAVDWRCVVDGVGVGLRLAWLTDDERAVGLDSFDREARFSHLLDALPQRCLAHARLLDCLRALATDLPPQLQLSVPQLVHKGERRQHWVRLQSFENLLKGGAGNHRFPRLGLSPITWPDMPPCMMTVLPVARLMTRPSRP